MNKQMLIDAQHEEETRVVIASDDGIEDFDFITEAKAQLKGNVYLAKITRVEPSLQAAFVEYGGGKQGFLPFSEIHADYYQIPTEDKKRLLDEEAEEAQREEEAEEAELEEREERKRGGGRNRRAGKGRHNSRRRGGRDKDEHNDDEAAHAKDADADDSDQNENQQGDDSVEYQAATASVAHVSSAPMEEGEDHAAEDDVEDEVESSGGDDVVQGAPRRRGASFKRYRIQEVIKRNQIVLVQVIKEERGNKGVSLTTYVSLAGRYCVLMPNSPKGGGVSRKISQGEQRKKLKEVVAELKDKRGLSAIIRTAGIDRTKTEIKRDYEYLVKLWGQIREDTLASTAPALIYEESDIIKRALRDMYTSDIENVHVQGEKAYKDAKTFMKMIMPSHAPRVKHYKDKRPLFAEYGVEEQLASMYEPTAKLPSGGYLVLQQTEALISIDVNSGRSTTERNVEETAIKTNLEAAREVARQLRLRDLAGLVVIDFIDMYYGKNRRTLERTMKDALKKDRAKVQVSRISPFGLMELSRQRLRPSIVESSNVICSHCEGTGYVRSVETVAIQIIRLLEREAVSEEYTTLKIAATADALIHLMNEKRHTIQNFEEQYNVTIIVEIDTALTPGGYKLVKVTHDGKEIIHTEDADGDKRKRRRGKRGGRGRIRDEQPDESRESRHSQDDEQGSSDEPEETDSSDDKQEREKEKGERPKRSRSRRGGRRANSTRERNRDTESGQQVTSEPADDGAASQDTSETADVSQTEDKPKPRRPRRRATTSRRKSSDGEGASEPKSEPESGQKSDESAPRDTKTAEPAKSESVISMNAAHTSASPEQMQEARKEDTGPKRRGWWSRVVES